MQKSNAQEVIWSNTYSAGTASQAYSIKHTIDGGFIIGGSASVNGRAKDIYIFKLTADGDTLWSQTLGGTADDEAFCISLTPDTGCIVAGYSNSYGSGSSDFFIVKLNKLGEIEWTSTNGGALADGSYSVITTKDGGYLAVGYTTSTGNGGRDIKAIKLNESGMVIWTKTYGGMNNETAYSVCQMYDSSYVIVGSTKSFGAVDNDVYVIKTNTLGDTLWTKVYAGTGSDIAYSVYPCEESGFVVAGKTNSQGAGGYDMLLMKIYDDGYLLWQKTFGGENDDVAYEVKETINHNFVLGGNSSIDNGEHTNSMVVCTNDFGEEIWEQAGDPQDYNELRALCITTDNQIAYAGSKNIESVASALVGIIINCTVSYPRGIWFGSCWKKNSVIITNIGTPRYFEDQTMLVNDNTSGPAPFKTWQDKVEDFVQYCKATKMHTVVLHHLQDILRQDTVWSDFANPPVWHNFSNYTDATCSCFASPPPGYELRDRLQKLVYDLHHIAGVSVVLAQWEDQHLTRSFYNLNYQTACSTCDYRTGYIADEDDETINNNLEILNAFKKFNDPDYHGGPLGFDGLMLDYEYFAPQYGEFDPNPVAPAWNKNYSQFLSGWNQWKLLAGKFIDARNDWPASGVKFVQCYLNYIVITDPGVEQNPLPTSPSPFPNGIFDISGPSGAADGVTDLYDTKAEIDFIDQKHFSALSMAFVNRDNINPTSTTSQYETNDLPTTFLTGIADAFGSETDQERQRQRVLLFGHDINNINTPISPNFRTVSRPTCDFTGEDAWLGDLLSGRCFWDQANFITMPNGWPDRTTQPNGFTHGYHYLPEIENEFLNQINTVDVSSSSPLHNLFLVGCGSVNFYQGFQWFQYGLNDDNIFATTHDALLDDSHVLWQDARGPDTYLNYFIHPNCLPLPNSLKKSNTTVIADHTVENKNPYIKIFPNPFNTTALVKTNLDFDLLDRSWTVIDFLGNDVSSLFKLTRSAFDENYSLNMNASICGNFALILTDNEGHKKYCSFVIIN